MNMDATTKLPGVIALEDGSVFRGEGFGAVTTVVGEAVFNTSMTGYQEILTDPSYFGQIVTMTVPEVGNYGINPEDDESDGVKVAGFVVREISPVTSNWRSKKNLHQYLLESGVPGISDVDTRAITKKLRVSGAMKACISTENISDEEAVERARAWEGLVGVDFVKEVSTPAPYEWDVFAEGNEVFTVPGTLVHPAKDRRDGRIPMRLVALDFGVKRSILKNLARHGFSVTVVPASTTAQEILALNPDGIFLSNGPGDPEPLDYAQQTVRGLVGKLPIFGICLGHQILALALGAKTFKLKFGHRGGNQPVKNHESELVMITAQNHGFAVLESGFKGCDALITEYNMNDNTVAGLRHKEYPVFSVQYHPEAGPGPNDAIPHFEAFYQIVKKFHDEKLERSA